MSHIPHVMADRPSWTCPDHAAPEPWPCEVRRLELVAEFEHDRPQLALYLADAYLEAVNDDIENARLYWAMVGWARSRQPPQAPGGGSPARNHRRDFLPIGGPSAPPNAR